MGSASRTVRSCGTPADRQLTAPAISIVASAGAGAQGLRAASGPGRLPAAPGRSRRRSAARRRERDRPLRAAKVRSRRGGLSLPGRRPAQDTLAVIVVRRWLVLGMLLCIAVIVTVVRAEEKLACRV